MDRVKFGQIVKSLRAEHLDHASGGRWTQGHLAAVAGLTEVIVGNIERGERTKLESDEIAGLADALRLTTLERQAFFAAATDVDEDDKTADLSEPDSAFDHVWNILSTTQLPAYLTDPLGNVVGINRIMMAFHGVSDQLFDNAIETDIGVNVLALIFRQGAVMRQSMGMKWDAIARANVQQFRFMALPYRYSKNFEEILSHMYKQPDFLRLWAETRTTPRMDFFSQLRYYDYAHAIHGDICYVATLSTVVTAHGNLYLTNHIPCNAETLTKFTKISEVEHGARAVMPWPCSVETD